MAFTAAPYEVEIYVACLIVGSLPQSGRNDLQSRIATISSMECNYRSSTYAEINDRRALSVKIGHTFQGVRSAVKPEKKKNFFG